MPKNIPPVDGRPASELLEEIVTAVGEQHGPNSGASTLVKAIREMVNLGTCLSPSQAQGISLQVQVVVSRETSGLGTNIDPPTRELAGLINSFRLECAHCSNQGCKQRDPTAKL